MSMDGLKVNNNRIVNTSQILGDSANIYFLGDLACQAKNPIFQQGLAEMMGNYMAEERGRSHVPISSGAMKGLPTCALKAMCSMAALASARSSIAAPATAVNFSCIIGLPTTKWRMSGTLRIGTSWWRRTISSSVHRTRPSRKKTGPRKRRRSLIMPVWNRRISTC